MSRNPRRRWLLTAAGLAAGSIPGIGIASTGAADTTAPTALAYLPGQPRLLGEGRLRWYGLSVYDARLYATGDSLDPERIATSAFALELRYARRLQGEEIAQASHREIVRLGYGSETQRSGWLKTMRGLFPDVQPGDRITGVHLPGGKTLFYRNDARLGVVEDRQFGEAFFGIWLDPRTVAPDLRRALLRGVVREPALGQAR